jgi:hypothetical protein
MDPFFEDQMIPSMSQLRSTTKCSPPRFFSRCHFCLMSRRAISAEDPHSLYVDRDSVHAGLHDERAPSRQQGLGVAMLMIPMSPRWDTGNRAGSLHRDFWRSWQPRRQHKRYRYRRRRPPKCRVVVYHAVTNQKATAEADLA